MVTKKVGSEMGRAHHAADGAHIQPLITPTDGPVVRRDLLIREIEGEFVLYDNRSRSAHRLNRSAAQVWSLCDGSRSTAVIAASLASEGVEDALSVVVQAVEQFERAGLLEG